MAGGGLSQRSKIKPWPLPVSDFGFSPLRCAPGIDSADKEHMALPVIPSTARGEAELVVDDGHFQRIVREGILKAEVSLEIMTADFKAMLVPKDRARAESIIEVFRRLADKGVEIRLLHAGTPSGPALRELKRRLPRGLTIRRCPRLHAKAVIVDSSAMYLGSANLTGAGLGAKGQGRRNFELGIWTRSEPLIESVQEQFNRLWEGDRCRNCRRKAVCPVPLEGRD